MESSDHERSTFKRRNGNNNRGQGYRRSYQDNWRKPKSDSRTNINANGSELPSVAAQARAEPNFEEQFHYGHWMSIEDPAYERALVGSASEQRNLNQNQENPRRREFHDKRNDMMRRSRFQEKTDAQRGRRKERSQERSVHGNDYYQGSSRASSSFSRGKQSGQNRIQPQNLSSHTHRIIANVNDDTELGSDKVEKSQFSLKKENCNINPNRPFGYKELEDMSQNSEPSEIIKLLNSEKKQFAMLLKKEMNFDWYYLIISLLAKLCKSDVPELHQSLFLDLLVMVKGSSFLAKFTTLITTFSTGKKIPNEKVVTLHKNFVSFFQTFMDKSPTSACDSVPEKYFALIVQMKAPLSINRYEVPQDVYDDVSSLQLRLDDVRKSFVNKNPCNAEIRLRQMAYAEELSHAQPPEDFRELNIVPTFEDLNYEENPFIRPALIHRAYKSIDHYLDVQFRLLREDFFSPLRLGIQEYRHRIKDGKKNRSKIDNIRIYHGVKFVDYDIVSGSYIVAFSQVGLARVIWENSKRLMNGSLLCLSKDDFGTGIFATVAKRDAKSLSEKGTLHVNIEEIENCEGYTKGSFIMAESSVYFEAYRNVLHVLQNYTEKNFPLKEFILGQVTDSHIPDYLSVAMEHIDTTYDLSAVLSPSYYRQSANILELDRIMTPGDLNLDKNQFEAFKLALTEKVAIIHGPPGTGKTYIGLKVVETLLANHRIWRINEFFQPVGSPILIVCYTNHALDQFLEGILDFTTNVVRIGGMSKSEKIKACNLSELRRKFRTRLNTAIDRRFLYEKRQNLRSITNELHKENGLIKLVEKQIVLHESELLERDLIPPKLSENFIQYRQIKEQSRMAKWLGVSEIHSLRSALEGLEKLSATSHEAMGILDHEDTNQEEENEIDGLERTITDTQNIEDSVDDFVSTVALKKTTRDSGHPFGITWSEELANEDIRKLEQLLETESLSEAEYKRTELLIESHKESTRLILKILAAISSLSQDRLNAIINVDVTAFTHLKVHERWILYGRWRQDILDELVKKRDSIERRYQALRKQINDLSVEEDSLYCKTMDVVAATTSGCAKYNKLIRHLAPKIVVMEEAAEVLESHTLVPLTSRCEHFILIGDHQQLRPSTASYKLAKKFNLDISMFERFIKLGMKHVTLSLQHRMRPEVARLIAPAIYQTLTNDSSVLDYPDVKGVKRNVFFLAHEVMEKADKEQRSHLNPHEAEISLNFARYLIQQGYLPSEITVLTTYSGQLLHMLQLRKRSFESLSGVKITIVDNYQGEENEIIILSLVRSNKDAKIGFLSIENRVCVALSRAKQGMYMIGNMESLDSNSKLWQSIHKTLDENNEIGTELQLVCQVHGTETLIKQPNDFNAVIEGGCTEKCNTVLRCGHICPSVCHITDRDHIARRCTKPCERYVCFKKHKCPKKCFEDCGNCMVKLNKELPCGHIVKLPCYVNELEYKCLEFVEKVLPDCNHIGRVHCSVDPKGHPCSIPCDFRLYCGHSCDRKCHVKDDKEHIKSVCMKPCSKNNKGCRKKHQCRQKCWEECNPCQFLINHELPCNHVIKIQCGRDMNDYVCKIKVEKLILECQHTNKLDCCVTPKKSLCKAKTCPTILSCGHKCMKACKEICSSADCQVLIQNPRELSCGHPEYNFCNKRNEKTPMQELLELCQEPCKGQLSCGHQCSGRCGQCLQGRLHKQCEDDCNRPLVCGHICKVKCSDRCPPCEEICQSKCSHSKCKARCGNLCTACEEPCTWNCPHKKCSKKCKELCDRDPCDEPCTKSLKCGHPCIGLCGEECPIQCRICNRAEIVDEFFLLGTEGDEDSRFVFLPDCKHAIEVGGMDYWMNEGRKNEIGLKSCPRCKTPITSINGRYSNVTRQVYSDVEKVKKRYYAEKNFINEVETIDDRISQIKVGEGCEGLSLLLNEVKRRIDVAITKANRMKKQKATNIVTMDKEQLETTKIQVDIVEKLTKVYDSATENPATRMQKDLLQLLVNHISRLAKNCLSRRKLAQQDVDDFSHEIERLDLIKCFYFVRSSPYYNSVSAFPKVSPVVRDTERYFQGSKKLSTEDIHRIKQLLKYLIKMSNTSIGIPEEEKKMILQAMDLKQGHWYKCPNGHIYCITECGGAMVQSVCNECKAPIGGASHRLRSDNELAREMDGARTSAWPDYRFA